MRAQNALIARRHVIYVGGYDPQGAEGYYRLFERSWKRFLTLWPLASKLGPLVLDSEDFAHWNIEAAGPNWQVSTRYEFSRQEHIIRANMAEPTRRQIPRALAWALDYLVSGALVRLLRTSWAFCLVLIYFQMMLIWWLVLSVAGGAGARHRYRGRLRHLRVAASARGPLVRGADQQSLAAPVRIRPRRAVLLRSAHRRLRRTPHRRRPRQRSRRDHRGRSQRRRRLGAGGRCARARARSRYRPPRTAAHPAHPRLDRAGSGAASQSRAAARDHRATCGRAVDSVGRLPVARGHHEFLGFRSGRGDRRPRRGDALQSLDLDAALPRYAVAAILPAAALPLLPPALPVHHGERSSRPVRLFHAAHRPGSGRDLGKARLRDADGVRGGCDFGRGSRAGIRRSG